MRCHKRRNRAALGPSTALRDVLMAKPWSTIPCLNKPELMLCFLDEYELARMCCVNNHFRKATSVDKLWQPHVALRSPALSIFGKGNYKELLGQLEIEHPRRCISDFTFCVDVASSSGAFVFSAGHQFVADSDGHISRAIMHNLLPVTEGDDTEAPSWCELAAEVKVRVLDRQKKSRLKTKFISGYKSSEHCERVFISAPVNPESEGEMVIMLTVYCRFRSGLVRDAECTLSVSAVEYIPPVIDKIMGPVGEEIEIERWDDFHLRGGYSSSSQREIVEVLVQLRKHAKRLA